MIKGSYFLSIILTVLLLDEAHSSSKLNIEMGQATNTYNKVKIDGKDGTLFNLAPSLDSAFYYRISLIKKFNSPHGLRLLYAPLNFSGEKRYSKDINFSGVLFPADRKTETKYQFNSYRGTYFYELVANQVFSLNVGGTLKIRDALIELKQSDRKKLKKNTGIVPLVYLYSEYKWENDFRVAFDFDGLIAPQGRAFDLALLGGYYFAPNCHLNLGVRMLEGGADNENVYTFAQVNYLFTSLQVNF